MDQFTFFVDQKYTIWERNKIILDAESFEDALKEIKEIAEKQEFWNYAEESDLLYEFMEMVPVNYDELPTLEIYSGDNQDNMDLVYTNGKY